MQVERTATPLTIRQMAQVLAGAESALGSGPDDGLRSDLEDRLREGGELPAEQIVVDASDVPYLENILAIAALENDNGKAIIQHNWGNVMATDAWRQKNDFWERKDPTLKPRFFRAYPSHEAGAAAFLELLSGKRHHGAVDAARSDDTAGVVDSLFKSGYVVPIPADQHPRGLSPLEQKAEYSNAVQQIREKLRAEKPFSPSAAPSPSPSPSPAAKSNVLALALPMLGLAFAAMVITGRKK